jgi:hypothetical protein
MVTTSDQKRNSEASRHDGRHGQSLPMAKGANPLKGKFLDTVTRSKTSGTEFNYSLDQSGQEWCHLRFSPLLIDKQGVQLHARPLRLDMHIN